MLDLVASNMNVVYVTSTLWSSLSKEHVLLVIYGIGEQVMKRIL
jgi:hypothetical protein